MLLSIIFFFYSNSLSVNIKIASVAFVDHRNKNTTIAQRSFFFQTSLDARSHTHTQAKSEKLAEQNVIVPVDGVHWLDRRIIRESSTIDGQMISHSTVVIPIDFLFRHVNNVKNETTEQKMTKLSTPWRRLTSRSTRLKKNVRRHRNRLDSSFDGR